MSKVYLGLGSNIGDRESNLKEALRRLAKKVSIEHISSIYETEPVGYLDQPMFLNLACEGKTELDPFAILTFAKDIESRMGRKPSFSNAPRPIDIDILFYDDRIIEAVELIVPHPRFWERAFVLVPLAEIAPEFIDPKGGKTVRELLAGLGDLQQVRRWGDVPSIGSAAL